MWGHTLLRVTIGLLFTLAGFNKVTGIEGVTGMLSGMGFPVAVLFAWILALAELIFGVLVLVGYKTEYTAWPLAVILLIATVLVVIPNAGITASNTLYHIISIAGLVTIALTGPGKYALTPEKR